MWVSILLFIENGNRMEFHKNKDLYLFHKDKDLLTDVSQGLRAEHGT